MENIELIRDEFYMNIALSEATISYNQGEVPIGAVIVFNNIIIGKGHNRRRKDKNVLHHAEMIAIGQACEYLEDWRLDGCTLYVTVEPCPMCSGAIIQSRMKRLVYGTKNSKSGSVGSVIDLFKNNIFNHNVEVKKKIFEKRCKNIMKLFFKEIREKN